MIVEGGTLEYAGGNCETVRGNSGLIRWASDADIQALYVEGGATMDFDYDLGIKSVTGAYVSAGATIIDTLRGVVWTNGIQLNGTVLAAVNLDMGTSYQVDISEIA